MSVGYLFFALRPLYEDLEISGSSLDTWAAHYLGYAVDCMQTYRRPDIKHCGISDDVMAITALQAALTQENKFVGRFCSYVEIIADPTAGSEWLYGSAGYLYLLRLVKAHFQTDAEASALLNDTAEKVIISIMQRPRPWKWHGQAYIGAVHGAIGIITQIVLTDSTWAPELAAELEGLLACQYESGNWPSSLPPGQDRLVQVCHGAPGVIISLLSIKQHFPHLRNVIERAIERGRVDIKERGLLTKEPSLCHGVSGNALSLDDDDCKHFLTFSEWAPSCVLW